MGEQENGLTIDELAQRVGVPVRTIRFYISQGLLPGPGARGKSATYGDEHLVRLDLIRRLVERRVPLAKIQAMLAHLPLEQARALLAEEGARADALQAAEQTQSPRDYVEMLLANAQETRRQPPPAKRISAPNRATSSTVVEPTKRGTWESDAVSPAAGKGRPRTDAQPSRAPAVPDETWHRLVLAPGIELQVRADVRHQQRELIERLLSAASELPRAPEGED